MRFRLFFGTLRGLRGGLALAATLAAATASAASGHPTGQGLVALSPAEQGVISQAIGRDDRTYHAVPSAVGPRAANARHEIQTEFTQRGIAIVSGNDRVTFALKEAGYGDALSSISPAAPHARANRVEYRRGTLVEWYANGPSGLEQGFTLSSSPPRRGTGRLTLALDLSGNLTASLDPDGRGLAFLRAGNPIPVLRYAGLIAYDAAGRNLPAHLELSGRTLLVRVDDAGARYPVVIDPFVYKASLYASDFTGEAGCCSFGTSVAISGNTIIVGAPNPTYELPGAAYVFVKPSSGWLGNLMESAKLTPSDSESGDRFGASVAIHGDTVIVGASHPVFPSETYPGAAYVFVKPAGGWAGTLSESAKLTASDGAAGDRFGSSAAVHGDTVVIGAPGDDQSWGTVTSTDKGSAYVFVKPAGGWAGALTQHAKLRAGGWRESFQAEFGRAVAVRGDTVVVGAPFQDVDGSADEGAAWIFVEPAGGWAGTPAQSAKLVSPSGRADDKVGTSVAISGDTVFVGAPGEDVYYEDLLFQKNRGAAYVFLEPAGGWTGQPSIAAKLSVSDGSTGDGFGLQVAASGDRVLVSGEQHIDAGYYLEPAGGWAGELEETEKVPSGSGNALRFFGLSGNTIVAGSDALNAAQVFVRRIIITFLNLRALSSETFPAGSTIPVEVQLNGEDAIPVSDREAEALASSCSVPVFFSGDGSTGCAGYDGREFHFELRTSARLAPGRYTITVRVLLDGEAVSAETVDVQIR